MIEINGPAEEGQGRKLQLQQGREQRFLTMLMVSAPVYHDVVEEYRHHGKGRRKRKGAKSMGQLPSYLLSSQAPDKSRKDDLDAYLSGQGAVYGGPDWGEEWNSARFLPELRDSHGSQVLLPFVKSQEKKRQAKEAAAARAAMLSKSMSDLGISVNVTQPADTTLMSQDATKHVSSATAQAHLDREREKNSRPTSAARSVNHEALHIKNQHPILGSRPQSRESVRPQGEGSQPSRPGSREGIPLPRMVDTPHESASRPDSQAAAARPATRLSPEVSAEHSKTSLASSTQVQGASAKPAKEVKIQKDRAKSGKTERSGDARGARSKSRGGDAGAGGMSAAGGGADSAVVEALQGELDAYKATEVRLKERLKDKDEQIHELTHKNFYLNDELNAQNERAGNMLAEVERARESNARFDDVKQLLQLTEIERVKLLDQVEQLQEDNMTWRPIQKKLEDKVEHLLAEIQGHLLEIDRLKDFEHQVRGEKDKVAAANIQVQTWQDIAADLQSKCERWEQVNDTTTLSLNQAKTEILDLKIDKQNAEARADRLLALLIEHDIEIPDDDEEEQEDREEAAEEGDDTLAEPLTTMRTTNLLTGKLPGEAVLQFTDDAEGIDSKILEPAFGTHEQHD